MGLSTAQIIRALALISSVTACPKSAIEPSARKEGYDPWTHQPACIGNESADEVLCAFTNANYHFGRGISIIATLDAATKLVDGGLLNPLPYEVPLEQQNLKYKEVQTTDRGVGLFVKDAEFIAAGERIMTDYPTLLAPHARVATRDVREKMQWQGLLNLPDVARRRTRNLARGKDRFADELRDIIGTNAFDHIKAGEPFGVIFPEVARINHACQPNAVTRTNDSTLAMEVIALRNIHPGEEIVQSYLDSSQELTSKERQELISKGWEFTCNCPICVGETVAASDVRRGEIKKLRAKLGEGERNPEDWNPAEDMPHLVRLLQLYEEEKMVAALPKYYWWAANAALVLEKTEEAVAYAGMAKKYATIVYGENSGEVRDALELESDPLGFLSR